MKKGYECNILGVSLRGKYVVAYLDEGNIVLSEMDRDELGIVTKINSSITNYNVSPKIFSKYGLSTYRGEVNAILDRVTKDMNVILKTSPANQEGISLDDSDNFVALSRMFMVCETCITYGDYLALIDEDKEIYNLLDGKEYEDLSPKDAGRVALYFGRVLGGFGTHRIFPTIVLPNMSFYERVMTIDDDIDIDCSDIFTRSCENCEYCEGDNTNVGNCEFRKKLKEECNSEYAACDLHSLKKVVTKGLCDDAEFFVYRK